MSGEVAGNRAADDLDARAAAADEEQPGRQGGTKLLGYMCKILILITREPRRHAA